eukprot:TRINITY_DN112016_c0_g1_i1.p1 TRINITY_DN112016_c0_g1~~TRINITY_DN112016_c0_g1_i1.p1  ORF type:complete len:303 (+),score=84.37 TRINITY_DN112016_c0_g1_i1:38-910(+)
MSSSVSSSLAAEWGPASAHVVDDEVARYARWIISQASVTSNVEQKLTALSRRAAAELRKAEQERSMLASRLELLEGCCWRAGLLADEQLPVHAAAAGAPRSGEVLPGSAAAELASHQTALAAALAEQKIFGEQLAARCGELESHLEKVCQDFGAKLSQMHSPDEARGTGAPQLQQLRDDIRWEVGKVQTAARDEVRIVHHEVMSLDARVVLLEERSLGHLPQGSSLSRATDAVLRDSSNQQQAASTAKISSGGPSIPSAPSAAPPRPPAGPAGAAATAAAGGKLRLPWDV